jgi:hypothetical protein
VVRWRLIDLAQWVFDELRVSISKQTLSREEAMRAARYFAGVAGRAHARQMMPRLGGNGAMN